MTDWMDEAVAERRAPEVSSKIIELALELRDKQQEAKDLEERFEGIKKDVYHLEHTALPEAMLEAGLDHTGIPGSGNQPGFDLKLKPFCHANIPVSWPPEKRQEAYEYLASRKAGDLFTIELVIKFGRGQEASARDLADKLAKFNPEIRPTVHWSTLTAWVKERYFEFNESLDLEKIGAQVGSIVKLVKRKE